MTGFCCVHSFLRQGTQLEAEAAVFLFLRQYTWQNRLKKCIAIPKDNGREAPRGEIVSQLRFQVEQEQVGMKLAINKFEMKDRRWVFSQYSV